MADVTEHVPFTDPAVAISQGKRHLLVRDYTAAVTAFAEGLELLSQKHGDSGDELGEPYLFYGRALLGLAREEAGVLGGGVPGTEDDDEEDAEEEDGENPTGGTEERPLSNDTEVASSSNEKQATEESKKSEDKIDDKTVDEKKEEKKTEVESEKKVEDSLPSSSKDDEQKTNGECSTEKNGNPEATPEEDDEDVNKEDEEDDPGRGIDLQVAWEVLELAKIVFSKRGKAGIKQLAEAHRLLGEVAMESGNPEVAAADLEKALTILQNLEPRDPRSMAELNYQLGLAHSLTNDFDASINHFKEATALLESRIKELKNTTEPAKSDDPFYSIEGEIAELNELLPEIQEKIADMKDFKQEACRLVIEEIKNQVASGSRTNGAGPSSESASTSADSTVSTQAAKPASDISHLVRKKRKNEESNVETESPCKKPTP